MTKKGRLFVVSAPSGAGKGTVIRKILELRPDLALSISATTRAPRTDEADGVSYYFVTHEAFREMVRENEFLEHAEYVGEYYGTPRKPVDEYLSNGKDVLLEIEIQGAKQVMHAMPECVTIFIVPPDMEELERRLRGRGTDSDGKLKARMQKAHQEMNERDKYMYIIVNDEVLCAAQEIISIIDSN